jgi:micrococcal nuclease
MKRHIRRVQLALAVVFTSVVSVFAYQVQQADPPRPQFTGKVVSVADGDTITVLNDNVQHRIRLEGIDCPESHQAFGTKAKQAIADKVFGKEVTIKWNSRDKYKRILGEVFLGDRHINLEMVQEGWAWHYVQYSKDPALAKAEKDARAGKKGLWADPNPIPPWEFRKGKSGAVEAAKEQQNGVELAKITVYGTKSGQKYHLAGCRSLAKNMMPMTLEEATKKYGETGACTVCNPPVLKVNAPPQKEATPPAGQPGQPSKAKPDSEAIPVGLRKGSFQVDKETIATALELKNAGWKYLMPEPKSAQAAWGNSDKRTTWYVGFWVNKDGSKSASQPKKNDKGEVKGDGGAGLDIASEGQSGGRPWRRGGSPQSPTKMEWLLSESGGIEPKR